MTLVKFRIPAYFNYGRWVVSCCRCPWADEPRPGFPVFVCQECGVRAEIEWPAEEMRHGIVRMLHQRPDRTKRNWYPGETLIDLMAENAAHGLYADAPGDLTVEPERIRVDTLPLTFRRELRAVEG